MPSSRRASRPGHPAAYGRGAKLLGHAKPPTPLPSIRGTLGRTFPTCWTVPLLIEIDENLCRAELTPAQRAAAVKRRKQIWEALHPENSGNSVSTIGPGRPKEFAADTAKAAGMTKQSINEHLARADALGDDLQAVAGTSLDKGVELDALKALPPPARKELIAYGGAAYCAPSADRVHRARAN